VEEFDVEEFDGYHMIWNIMELQARNRYPGAELKSMVL